MKTLKWLIGASLLGSALLFGAGSMLLFADERYEEHEKEEHENKTFSNQASNQQNALYKEECGACHLAYPAALLPEKSWNKIMAQLDDHFDENAELDKESYQVISSYLSKYAADKNRRKTSRMMRNFPKGKTPIRITALPYFIRKHDEIPARLVKNNPKVGSFSQCEKCHKGAEVGNFNEHQVKIPGYGRWED